ncbi:MAG: carboxypeptidase-like regulatory domain-containing protein [Polyangiaceae bacterium]
MARTLLSLSALAGLVLLPAPSDAQPVTCPTYPDTRQGQIDRGICAAQKLKPLARDASRDLVNRVCEGEIPCVVGVCHVARNVCKGLLEPSCNHGGLELPADGPAFRNAACRAPRGGCSSGGTAEEQRICGEIAPRLPPSYAPPDAPTRSERQIVNPKYHVVSVLYAPPGRGSEVGYAESSTLGTKTSFSALFGGGVAIKSITSVSDLSASYTYSNGGGTSFEVRKGKTTSLGLDSQMDGVDHGKDMFLVWLNPQLVVEKSWFAGNWTRFSSGVTTRDGRPIKVVLISASKLANPSTMSPQERADFAGFTPRDFAGILSASPFSGGKWDPDRFEKLESIQVSGPASSTDAIPTVGLELSEDTTKTYTRAAKHSVEVDATFGLSASFVIEAGVKVGGRVTFESTSSDDLSQSSGQRASLKLKSSTVGYDEVVDVYFDRVFKTFAFKGHGQLMGRPPTMGGVVRQANGAPAAGQVVTVKLSDGSLRRLGTDAAGRFRILELPSGGAATIATGSDQKMVPVTPTAQVELRAANAPTFSPLPKALPLPNVNANPTNVVVPKSLPRPR